MKHAHGSYGCTFALIAIGLLLCVVSAFAQPKIVVGPVVLADSTVEVHAASPVEFSDTTTTHRMYLLLSGESGTTLLNFRVMYFVQRGSIAVLDTTTLWNGTLDKDTLFHIGDVTNLAMKKSWFPSSGVNPSDSVLVYSFIEAQTGWKYTFLIKTYGKNTNPGNASLLLLER